MRHKHRFSDPTLPAEPRVAMFRGNGGYGVITHSNSAPMVPTTRITGEAGVVPPARVNQGVQR